MDGQTSFLADFGLYSYAAAVLAFTVLATLGFMRRDNSRIGLAITLGSALTAVWAGAVVTSILSPEPRLLLMQLTELARNAGWTFALVKLLSLRFEGAGHESTLRRWSSWLAAGYATALALILVAGPLSAQLDLSLQSSSNIAFGAWLGMAVLGLLLLEQFFRNSSEFELWGTKHLCIALGILFAYDFFMYAEALLFQHLDRNLWQARGVVITMAAALMAISIVRDGRKDNEDATRTIYMSRHVAFHSLTLLASGIYLIAMSLAAYFIRYLGGSWGGVLQITFLCAAGLVLVMLLFSGQIRSRVRVWLSKNFFSYKYDYRLEWLQFTQKLASVHSDIPLSIVQAVATLTRSPGGILWGRTEGGHLSTLANWEMPDPGINVDVSPLVPWLEQNGWIIDLQEWQRAPDLYKNLELPRGLDDIPRAWLLIPLLFGDRLQGVLLLKQSEHLSELNWEDRDLLKVAGRQAASHLAQFQADQALVESRQFEAFNRLSAYVIHDLKNILAQLSLMVSNAEKHKHKPEFVDDMVDTVSNSVNRMTKLMAQLRSDVEDADRQEVELATVLTEVVNESKVREPAPSLQLPQDRCAVHCERERLHAVFGHLIHNAQDATDRDGRVDVRLLHEADCVIVEIEDDGKGMDEEFIQQRLFKPFDSTKGLTGMGIGAFESRDFIRSIGGEISVRSAPGDGSLFRVRIPRQAQAMGM